MNKINVYKHIDYTLLKPDATYKEIFNLCREALVKSCASVCIPPHYVKFAHRCCPSLNICTVVGFPLGNSTTEAKISEAITAISNGANEIDMVINISELKNEDYEYVTDEINKIQDAIGDDHILKVIIETCYLTQKEIRIITKLIDAFTPAAYIKTSTGFGTRGASIKDITTIKSCIQFGTKIKASGGIHTYKEMERYIALGCDRIGASQLPPKK